MLTIKVSLLSDQKEIESISWNITAREKAKDYFSLKEKTRKLYDSCLEAIDAILYPTISAKKYAEAISGIDEKANKKLVSSLRKAWNLDEGERS